MLVLSRKLGEVVVIGDNIRLTVVALRGNQVRLGFTAPVDVPIHRAELGSPADGSQSRRSRPTTADKGP